MRLTNSDVEYGLVSKALHWAVAVLLVLQFAGGVSGVDRDVHASLGLLLLALVIIRWLWRMLVSLPDWAPSLNLRERRLVHLYELVIYAMLFAKPITGLLLLAAGNEDVHLFGVWELRFGPGEDGAGPGRGRGRGGDDDGRDAAENDDGNSSLDDLEDLFGGLHFWSGVVLLAAVAVHVGLVLRHQLLLKDGLFRRIWFGRSRESHESAA